MYLSCCVITKRGVKKQASTLAQSIGNKQKIAKFSGTIKSAQGMRRKEEGGGGGNQQKNDCFFFIRSTKCHYYFR